MDVVSRALRVAEALGPLILAFPEEERPRFLAMLERRAAERYDAWAEAVPAHGDAAAEAASLRACAARERAIADRIEERFPPLAGDRSGYEPVVVEISAVYLGAFEGASRLDGYGIQAALERSGAATWRAFAGTADPARRAVLLECAALEEASAECLERLCAPPR